MDRDSSVGIATRYGLDGPVGRGNVLHPSRHTAPSTIGKSFPVTGPV